MLYRGGLGGLIIITILSRNFCLEMKWKNWSLARVWHSPDPCNSYFSGLEKVAMLVRLRGLHKKLCKQYIVAYLARTLDISIHLVLQLFAHFFQSVAFLQTSGWFCDLLYSLLLLFFIVFMALLGHCILLFNFAPSMLFF